MVLFTYMSNLHVASWTVVYELLSFLASTVCALLLSHSLSFPLPVSVCSLSFCFFLSANGWVCSGGPCLTRYPWWSRAHWKESSASWTTFLAPSATTTLCPLSPASTAVRNRSMAPLCTLLPNTMLSLSLFGLSVFLCEHWGLCSQAIIFKKICSKITRFLFF